MSEPMRANKDGSGICMVLSSLYFNENVHKTLSPYVMYIVRGYICTFCKLLSRAKFSNDYDIE